MFHDKRIWKVASVPDAGELVEKLHNTCWCLCNGFRLGDYLFLNDAGSAEPQRSVVLRPHPLQ